MAQSQEDLDLFNRLVNDSQAEFGRKVRVTTWFRVQREDQLPPPPMTEAEVCYLLVFQSFARYVISCGKRDLMDMP